MFIYLAHPIDLGRADELTVRASDVIMSAGYAVFDPATAWSVPAKPSDVTARAVNNQNLAIIKRSSGVVAVVQPELMSFGVPLELRHARRHIRPTVVFTDDAKRVGDSLVLAALGVQIVGTAEALAQVLAKWRSLKTFSGTTGNSRGY